MRPPVVRILGLMLITGCLSTAPAVAAEPAYIGTWALEQSDCVAPQENEKAPLVITKDRYDQHESHCTFKTVDGGDGEWKVTSDCSVEGSATPYDFTLTVSGDTLTFTDTGGARDFLRCK